MATQTQFVSLDGTALYGEQIVFKPSSNAMARRSASIFSRRGSQVREQPPPFIAQAAIRAPAIHAPKEMTQRQKNWIKRRSAPAKAASPHKPKGTILNAVPPAKTIHMTPLEEEMATSPNEEIMSAVNGTPIVSTAPADPFDSILNKPTTPPLTERTRSVRTKEVNTRIGLWVNGVAHWDADALRERAEPGLDDTGFTPVRRLTASRSSKPLLSVVIPSSELLINDKTISTLIQPAPQRAVVPIAPASLFPQFALSSPTTPKPESRNVSPVGSTNSLLKTPKLEKTSAPVRMNADKSPLLDTDGAKECRSSSTSSFGDLDDTSVCSQRSSATSVEVIGTNSSPENGAQNALEHSPGYFYIASPTASTVSEEPAILPFNLNKPLPPIPVTPPQRPAPTPPLSSSEGKEARHGRSKSASGFQPSIDSPAIRRTMSSQSLPEVALRDQDLVRNTLEASSVSQPSTPTFSQAADDLEVTLSTLSDERGPDTEGMIGEEKTINQPCSIRRDDSIRSVMHPPERAPTVPRRSRKREWRNKRKMPLGKEQTARRRRSESNLTRPCTQHEALPRRRRSLSATGLSFTEERAHMFETPIESSQLPTPTIVIDDSFVAPCSTVVHNEAEQEAAASSSRAEVVLLRILASLNSTQDLFNTAIINKGMYRVFKENELHLIRAVHSNESPPAAEFREWCPQGESDEKISDKSCAQPEYTPKSYMSGLRRDLASVEALKGLILAHCQTCIRRETAFALSTPTHPNAQRFNDAFWRIWCFCKIFGSGKGREDDVTGQLDWLKGGLLANNQELTATMNMNLEYDMGSVLLNVPEQFAKGNGAGLTAQQLYDMTEIWTCLMALLQGFQGRLEQAWEFGIYDECGIGPGDDETELELLDEWIAYLLSLGPVVVLEMAALANDPGPAGFTLAKVKGWTTWSPLQTGSRNTFLKEPVSRLYEERVAAAASKFADQERLEKKEMSRKRVANLALEIKLARQSSTFKRLPLIDMSMERQMSVLSRRNSTTSTHSVRSPSSTSIQRQPSNAPRRTSSPLLVRPRNFSMPRPRSPPRSLWSPRKISPIIEDRVETFNRMSLQNFDGVAEDTSERAVSRIVDMGFSAAEAREALKITDIGDGLRVDRAVDMLLRQRR